MAKSTYEERVRGKVYGGYCCGYDFEQGYDAGIDDAAAIVAEADAALAHRDEQIADLRAKLAEAEAAVERLPKDATGKTVVPTNGPVVMYDHLGNPGHLHYDPAVGWIVWQLCEVTCIENGQEMPHDTPTANWPKAPQDCYLIEEAARAAAEKGKD